MRINEAKEKLPIDFLTAEVSHGWEEVGNLKAKINGIKQSFTGTEKVEKILQELLDSYLICIGQLEMFLDKKNYIDVPKDDELKETYNAKTESTLTESNEAEAEPFMAKKFEDNNKTEIFTKLPDYDVEVEQKGDKIEIELNPTNATVFEDEPEEQVENNARNFELNAVEEQPNKNQFEYFTDFEEPEPDIEETEKIRAWLSR